MFEGLREYFLDAPVEKESAPEIKQEVIKVVPDEEEEPQSDPEALTRVIKHHVGEGNKKKFEELLKFLQKNL